MSELECMVGASPKSTTGLELVQNTSIKDAAEASRSGSSNASPPPVYVSGPEPLASAFASLVLTPWAPAPTVPSCLVHLKLLEAFHQLRDRVSRTDGLFGLADRWAAGASQNLRLIHEKRWGIYVTRAVDRFESWWRTFQRNEGLLGFPVLMSDLKARAGFERWPSIGRAYGLTPATLPPLGRSPCAWRRDLSRRDG